jgi:hypothetical protein
MFPPPPSPEYFPFKNAPFRMAMGLNELDLRDWIQIDEHFADELALKERLLAERHAQVFRAAPETETASREVLELLTAHLLTHFPHWFRRDGSAFTLLLTGKTYDLNDARLHPLDLAARLVQEDLCLMQARGDSYRLTAASVCFPSRWNMPDKIDHDLLGIHGVVPFYADALGMKTDRFFELLTEDMPVWRMNWNVHEDPTLFQPEGSKRPRPDPEFTAENAGEKLWIRIERQTLRRLAASGAILFAIRTYRYPLSILRRRPDIAAELAGAIRHMPPETAQYKSQGVFAEAALAWLDDVAR